MRELLDFLVRKRHWFLFLLLEIISFALIFRSTTYQRNIMLSTANRLTGGVISISGSIQSYLNLREANRELLARNGELEMELLYMQDQLKAFIADTATYHVFVTDSAKGESLFHYDFVTAKVINNSVARINNYITIDKGALDGIMPDMGVVSDKGVVGFVSTVSENYAVVIPVLNPKFRLSGKVLGSSYFGSMSWNGRSTRYANLDELPRHVEFHEGDTIITSGYSAAFPEGIIVGTVSSFRRQSDDNFYSLEVELATDFHALNNVRIIKNYKQEEQHGIERQARQND